MGRAADRAVACAVHVSGSAIERIPARGWSSPRRCKACARRYSLRDRESLGSHTRTSGVMMVRLLRHASVFALLAPLALTLCGFTTTTTDPNKAEVVTTDVAHFWQAFDDAGKAPEARRVEIFRKEYCARASQGLKDLAPYRHVTPE